MSKSHRLTLAEITEVFRIIQEAIDNGTDPVAWRCQMLIRVCKLIDALWGVAFLMPMQFDPKDLKPPLFVYTPLPPDKQKGCMTL